MKKPQSHFLNVTIILLISFFINEVSVGQQIYIDESLEDWNTVSPFYTDADDSFSTVNFGVLKVANDDKYLYFYLEVGIETTLQENNNITFYIDTDNNSNTGVPVDNIGADVEYNLGQRYGALYEGGTTSINSYNIGLVSAPTVTSDWFEFKIDLDTEVNGAPLFIGNEIGIVFNSGSGDQIPETNETLIYNLTQSTFSEKEYQIKKPANSDFRVLSYNVRRDDLFDPSLQVHFERLIKAIDPEIIGFQEIYNNSGEQAAQLIEQFLPSENGEQWYWGDTGNDNLIVSRYPVLNQLSVDGNAAYLLELEDRELFTIVAHPPCCSSGDNGRQNEIDAIMEFVRDSKSGNGFEIQNFDPILIMGDMNFVGSSQQPRTLLTGDISDNNSYGPDFDPDWDGSSLEDVKPMNPELPTSFTWYSGGSSFSAGRLDYIVYSGSVLELNNSFSLFTPSLPADTLTQYGLERNDSIQASDHMPIVADFTLPVINSAEEEEVLPKEIELFQNYPNPFNPSTSISFSLKSSTDVSLSVYNSTGQQVANLINNKWYPSGTFRISFEAGGLASGIYMYKLEAGDKVITKKMLLVK